MENLITAADVKKAVRFGSFKSAEIVKAAGKEWTLKLTIGSKEYWWVAARMSEKRKFKTLDAVVSVLESCGLMVQSMSICGVNIAYKYDYTIQPRSQELGGGWYVTLLEDGLEVGAGIFPAQSDDGVDYSEIDARAFAEEWRLSRAK